MAYPNDGKMISIPQTACCMRQEFKFVPFDDEPTT
jgi:hypothetical protein